MRLVVGGSRREGTSRMGLVGGTTVLEEGGRPASGRGRKVLVGHRMVLERNKLVVGVHRQASERNMLVLEVRRKVLVLHMMALHFCWRHKQ